MILAVLLLLRIFAKRLEKFDENETAVVVSEP